MLLIVNVASECGYTDGHYADLTRLKHDLGKGGHFEVLAFPCNQFGGQEPKVGPAFTLHLFQISMCKLQIPFALLHSHLYDAFPVIDPQIKHIYTKF